MSLLTAAIVTGSEITVRRAPAEFLEIELAVLEEMGFSYTRGEEYLAGNGRTRLVDLTTHPSTLRAPIDKIHPMPFPGLNIDNLPFFALIAACAEGSTLVHDWVYENRALHLTELTKLGAKVTLMDPHRLHITGTSNWPSGCPSWAPRSKCSAISRAVPGGTPATPEPPTTLGTGSRSPRA